MRPEGAAATMSLAYLLPSIECAFERAVLIVELSAAGVLCGSSVHPIHDLDHAELIERAEIVLNISDIVVSVRRGHRHSENERIY